MRERLLDIYHRMQHLYGAQHWWPADTTFEVMVGAVLAQATAWTNVEKAIKNLAKADALSPTAIRQLGHDELARLVYPAGYYNSKARKLKALAEYLGRRFNDDLDLMTREDLKDLRLELLEVYGIGEETADDILLYALGKPVFVVDAYTRRVFSRLGLVIEKAPYSIYSSMFMDNLAWDPGLFNEYHALIVRHGKEVCRRRPVCQRCCLSDICPTGSTAHYSAQRTRDLAWSLEHRYTAGLNRKKDSLT